MCRVLSLLLCLEALAFVSFRFNGEKELIIVEFLKDGSDRDGVRLCQGLELLGEVLSEYLNAKLIHFKESSAALLPILGICSEYL